MVAIAVGLRHRGGLWRFRTTSGV